MAVFILTCPFGVNIRFSDWKANSVHTDQTAYLWSGSISSLSVGTLRLNTASQLWTFTVWTTHQQNTFLLCFAYRQDGYWINLLLKPEPLIKLSILKGNRFTFWESNCDKMVSSPFWKESRINRKNFWSKFSPVSIDLFSRGFVCSTVDCRQEFTDIVSLVYDSGKSISVINIV